MTIFGDSLALVDGNLAVSLHRYAFDAVLIAKSDGFPFARRSK